MWLELLYILYIFIKYETFASIMLEKGSSQYTYNLVMLLNFRFMYILNMSWQDFCLFLLLELFHLYYHWIVIYIWSELEYESLEGNF